MKKYVKYLCLLFFCIFSVPAAVEAAGNNNLTVEDNKVSVSVSIPEGKTETITSLRMQLLVTITSGSVKQPAFQFEDAIPSLVKDAAISSKGDNAYTVDLVLSGKREQSIFGGSEFVKLGTLSFEPSSQACELKVEVVGEDGNAQEPSVAYVDANGLSAITAPLPNAEPVTLTVKETSQEVPVQKPFDAKVKLTASVKKGTNRVNFSWEKADGAAGYILYRYDTKAKKCTLLKTVKGGDVTTYSRTFAYGSTYSFKVRPYREEANGSVKYGRYSSAVKAKVELAQATGVTPEYQSETKVSLSWQKTNGAKGYQIYRSTKKNGKYKLVKTIKKGTITSCSNISHPRGKVYYYKVRAYAVGEKGQRVYGKFSVQKPAAPKKPKLRLKKKTSGRVTLSWNKVARADGYYIYRSTTKSGKYVCIKTIKGGDKTSYAMKLPGGARSCYYKMCAYQKQNGKNQKGAYSVVKKGK